MKVLCDRLELQFDKDYINKWYAYNSITGDNTTPSASRFSRISTIKSNKNESIDEGMILKFQKTAGYAEAIDLLGYDDY